MFKCHVATCQKRKNILLKKLVNIRVVRYIRFIVIYECLLISII